MAKERIQIMVCGGTGCTGDQGEALLDNLKLELEANALENSVNVVKTGCMGLCSMGPNIKILPDNIIYTGVRPDDAREIVSEHIMKGRRIERLLFTDPGSGEKLATEKELSPHRKQLRIALRNCGIIDPESIDDAIAHDAYEALATALTNMKPLDVIKLIKDSGLRGRGGGGFPTGIKWEIAFNNKSDVKYVVCNADEGDPGAFMDRSILEGDPHAVLEAMAICGYAIEAAKGLIYIRAEYPLAVSRLNTAIRQAREYGLLGTNIMGSDFSFDIEIKYGAGAFVCGEETALIHSMEGDRGEPTVKPPFPAVSGFREKPTIVNNVETYACISPIILKGSEWFSSIGTEKSKGTKVFALAGKINNVGLIEVPMGTTLREVINEIGGGIRNGKKFKAAQTGGPSGGCLTEKHLDTPIDFDNLIAAGSMMGSGGLIVMDEDDCMVSVAKFFLEFTVEESCGKCSPCRIGNKRMHELLEHITKGKGVPADLERLKNMCHVIKDTSLCGLGQSSPNPVLSTLENFREEYEAHVTVKKCPAGKCKDLMEYFIIAANCVGCTACARVCPVGAISGERKEPHVINPEICIKCGACMEKCKFDAIIIQ
ncbi:MAG TPA: NADH-quinone oxidoreductase subunit NuoF [Bacteroidales bacterium]|jgi:NADH:ubiquinone oxidoreductase subunit F (NADH-binding)/(2Fe-2S) ferredoxin|nr:NADH-quinone oxidoreductase subunit NuoF [Bacteroidales bacterium]HQH23938.1 NADH-quinone oxidoreductase subunit NuoF [Bacteroidales bacterium]HQJ81268.1 NADH-quinone oxidoreductase subunit NuoF [Bacteroidales bacterium]